MVFYSFLIFIVAMVLLLKGADLFVDEAARMARLLGVSGFVIGLTLVSVGTSLPELATSVTAAFLGKPTIILGNIIGSNIANIGLVLGIAAVLTTIILKRKEYMKDIWFLLGVSVLFYVLSLDGAITFTEGLAFLVIFSVYTYFLLRRKPEGTEKAFKTFLKNYVRPVNGKLNLKNYEACLDEGLNYRMCQQLFHMGVDVKGDFKRKLLHDVYTKLFFCAISLVAIYFGSKYLVTSTLTIATSFSIAPEFISITAIAVGTSLPELFVTLTSAKKGMSSILIGNLVGSGIANILLIGGVAALITPLLLSKLDLYFFIPYMIFMSLVFIQFVRSEWATKVLGGVLLLLFYTIFIFLVTLFQAL